LKTKSNITQEELRIITERSERLEEELARQNIAFEAVFKLVEKLGTTLDLEKIVRLFLLTVMGQLRLKGVSLFIATGDLQELLPVRSLGRRSERLKPIPSGSPFARWVRTLDGPSSIDEFFNNAGSLSGEDIKPVRDLMDAGYSYCAPLKDSEELVGALLYSSRITGEPFGDFDDSLLMMLCRVATITIRNANLYQAAVRSKAELERFSRVKREFINHTSHELRTPLTVLKSALWSIEPEEVDAGILVDMARDAVSRLQTRVEHLLSLNEIELDNSTFNFEICDVSSIIEDCLREVIPELESKHIKVNFEDNVKYKTMKLDSKKIKIVLRSIIDNALNFVERGGNIDISIDLVDEPDWESQGIEIGDWKLEDNSNYFLSSRPAGEVDSIDGYLSELSSLKGSQYLLIRIKDDGIGIPPEEIRSLAEPFKRASNSTVRNVKGLGIGLSVSQKIVAGHGGKLFCKSEVGRGAEFSIWLPVME